MNKIITLLWSVHFIVSLAYVALRDCAMYVQVLVARVCAVSTLHCLSSHLMGISWGLYPVCSANIKYSHTGEEIWTAA